MNFDKLNLSTDPNDIDISFVINFLKKSYWAKDRTEASIRLSLKNSICFSLLLDEQQIGFARIVTDKVVYAYLMDVFIDPLYQGKGYGSYFIDQILLDPVISQVECMRLATVDAHPFYQKKGFINIKHPEYLMEKKKTE